MVKIGRANIYLNNSKISRQITSFCILPQQENPKQTYKWKFKNKKNLENKLVHSMIAKKMFQNSLEQKRGTMTTNQVAFNRMIDTH